MPNNIKSKINFALTKLKKADSKFRITRIHSTNDKNDELSFGNSFNILTKIDPSLAVTFTIVDEINDKIIMSYGVLKQLSYLKSSQQSWDKPISEWFWKPSDCSRINFRL